ncbi:MAG: hypothetical protein U1E78_13505 [Gammaproteobacteria bacterium]
MLTQYDPSLSASLYSPYAEAGVALMNSSDSANILHTPGYAIGQAIGDILGTCDEYGRPTESSYPLDRLTNFIHTKYQNILAGTSSFLKKMKGLSQILGSSSAEYGVEETLPSESAIECFDREKHHSSIMISERIDSALDRMKPLLLKFRLEIQKAINDSIINGKPLLILIGEHHYSPDSALMEAFIINLLNTFDDFQYQTIFTESFETDIYGLHEGMPHPNEIVEQLAERLNKLTVPMDLGTCKLFKTSPDICEYIDYSELMNGSSITLQNVTSASGMKKRNQIMTNVMNTLRGNGNAVAIVGQYHLFGLMNETTLQEHYHVVPIALDSNACFMSHRSQDNLEDVHCEFEYRFSCFEYLTGGEALQLDSELGLDEYINHPYSSDVIIEKTKRAAMDIRSEEAGDIAGALVSYRRYSG